DPAKWPCPRADEGAAGCEKRCWKDHKDRTAPAETKLKWYFKEHRTFGCRFYDRMARSSPCEAGMHEYWLIQLVRPGAGPVEKHARLSGATFVATDESGAVRASGSTPRSEERRVGKE